MSFANILIIAVGLSMDAFAVAIATGLVLKQEHLRHALRMGVFFGLFQALMPGLGWLAGLTLRSLIVNLDHWLAFGLLSLVGGKMIYEALWLGRDNETAGQAHALTTLLFLSLATSIDALAVGLSLSFLRVEIAGPSLIIGAVCFAFTFAGVFVGSRVGHLFERKIEVAGGLILIVIGVKILVEHLTA